MEENTQQTNSQPSKKSNNSMMYIVILIVVIVAAGGGWYAHKKTAQKMQQPALQMQPTQPAMKMKATDMTATETPSKAMASPSAMDMNNSAAQKIEVSGFNFGFTPKTITVKKGQKVELTFKSTDGTHDFYIDELNVKSKMVQTGTSTTVEFTPDKAGTFDYYCSVGNHRAMGMQGKITVE
jgi:nitrite reductase (NO-forming)